MTNVSIIAGNIALKVSKTKFIDPMIILTIISILFNGVRLWWDCRKYHQNIKPAFSLARMHFRNRLENITHRELEKNNQDLSLIKPIVDEIMFRLDNKSEDELQGLIKECETYMVK